MMSGAPGRRTRGTAESLPVSLLAAVADRRKEAEDGIEALVLEGELAEVGLHPGRPLDLARDPSRLRELDIGAVDADDIKAELGERDRVAAEASGRVEDVRRRLDACERCGQRASSGESRSPRFAAYVVR